MMAEHVPQRHLQGRWCMLIQGMSNNFARSLLLLFPKLDRAGDSLCCKS